MKPLEWSRAKSLFKPEQGHKILLGGLLLFLGAYRLLLIQSGQLYWPDEFRYLHALHLLDELRKGEVAQALYWIFGAEAGVASRPSYILFSLAPAALQGVANLVFEVQPTDATFYRIPVVANVAVSLGLTGTIYYIIWSLSGDRVLALVGASVHGLLANTNMYVRHLFPYDTSLLVFLISLGILLAGQANTGRPLLRAGVAGLLSGFAATTYPGYYLFTLIPLALLLANRPTEWRSVAAFVTAVASVGIIWEGTARLGGFSFIGASQRFSITLSPESPEGVQGAHEEGFLFLPMYLVEIEGLAGVALGLLFLGFIAMAVRGGFDRRQVMIVAAAVLAYLIYATTVQVFHRALFYGRLVHMFIPVMILAAMLAVTQFRRPGVRYGIVATLLALSVISFVPNATTALEVRFPKDLARELTATLGPGIKICGLGQQPKNTREGSQEACDLFLENARHLYPLPDGWKAEPPAGFVLVGEFPHPMQFRPYWFEGYTPSERKRLAADPPLISLFTRLRSSRLP